MSSAAPPSAPGWGPDEVKRRVRGAVGLMLADGDAATVATQLARAGPALPVEVVGRDVVTGLDGRALVTNDGLAAVILP